jgi:hypothetical protein
LLQLAKAGELPAVGASSKSSSTVAGHAAYARAVVLLPLLVVPAEGTPVDSVSASIALFTLALYQSRSNIYVSHPQTFDCAMGHKALPPTHMQQDKRLPLLLLLC